MKIRRHTLIVLMLAMACFAGALFIEILKQGGSI